ncbi:hypothetical protein [Paenimyroides ceti]|uniref:hypothetical protein n=1 Tax=Paenimyroides ceti TaxID=395087 RepID=UPI0029500181|nr:hypothetical protein [Paenimyroides ceti]
MKRDGLYFDTPDQLIKQGVFDHFFDDETIIFLTGITNIQNPLGLFFWCFIGVSD